MLRDFLLLGSIALFIPSTTMLHTPRFISFCLFEVCRHFTSLCFRLDTRPHSASLPFCLCAPIFRKVQIEREVLHVHAYIVVTHPSEDEGYRTYPMFVPTHLSVYLQLIAWLCTEEIVRLLLRLNVSDVALQGSSTCACVFISGQHDCRR